VSVATLWARPAIARPLDRPALREPAHMSLWMSRLTAERRAWLVGRLETQALFATRVIVIARHGAWSRVLVPAQPSSRARRGYPGWVPTVQLTGNTGLWAGRRRVAVVRRASVWARDRAGRRALRLVYGTRLPVVDVGRDGVVVATPNGGRLVVGPRGVAVYAARAAIPRPSGARLAAVARRFVGLQYLWAGTSSWGFDCSGLTHTVYARFGIRIPRDAHDQATRGRAVSLAGARPGDLLFFAGPGGAGRIRHVAMYAGAGRMVESPRTGLPVRVVPVATRGAELAAVRRLL
jgi:cell wall-associated NlpC family hydrolase